MEGHNNKVFLTVLGSSPAVVTESLYAFLFPEGRGKPEQGFIPDNIVIITTTHGAAKAKEDLCGKESQITKLYQEYGYDDIPNIDIKVIEHNGKKLEDVRTEQENEAMADFITNEVRELCSDDNNQLYVSMSGGRKTMSFYMGYILSLFGRPQDQLSHVLVDETKIKTLPRFEGLKDYEILPKFFFPKKDEQVGIELGDVPFVRLNNDFGKSSLAKHFYNKKLTFSQVVKLFQLRIAPPKIEVRINKIETDKKEISRKLNSYLSSNWKPQKATQRKNEKTEIILSLGGVEINDFEKFTEAEISIYVWLLKKHQSSSQNTYMITRKTKNDNIDKLENRPEIKEIISLQKTYADEVGKISSALYMHGGSQLDQMIETFKNHSGIDLDYIRPKITGLNKKLKKYNECYAIDTPDKPLNPAKYKAACCLLNPMIDAACIKLPEEVEELTF